MWVRKCQCPLVFKEFKCKWYKSKANLVLLLLLEVFIKLNPNGGNNL